MPDKIVMENVSHGFGSIPVLRKTSLRIEKGEIILIGGSSGSGKSTLLEICAGLITPQSGDVFWDGTSLKSMQKQQLLKARRKMGYVFQVNALISNHSIFDNIALPLRSRHSFSEKEIASKVHYQMEELGLFGVDNMFPEALSIGQLKAVAMARALIGDPDMLMLDEPLSGLDPQAAQGIVNVLYEHRNRKKMTIVMVSHDLNVCSQYSVRILGINSGKLGSISGNDEQIIR